MLFNSIPFLSRGDNYGLGGHSTRLLNYAKIRRKIEYVLPFTSKTLSKCFFLSDLDERCKEDLFTDDLYVLPVDGV